MQMEPWQKRGWLDMGTEDILRILLGLAVGIACLCLLLLLISRRHTRHVLQSLSDMLQQAIDGSFRENCYDESMLSQIESKMVHYLSASENKKCEWEGERSRIRGLVSDISHQTKVPLSNIILYSQLLGEQQIPAEHAHYVEAINMQAEKLEFLIHSLVKMSRLESGLLKLQPVEQELSDVIDRVMQQAEAKAMEKDVTLSAKATAAKARFDLKWTREALYNILDNAIKYTPAGGRVTITAGEYEMFAVVRIRDTGIGIAEPEQAQVFTRFYRSEQVQDEDGIGLGLYIARQVISGEGGYIKIKSELGAGTEFAVYLPKTLSKNITI